MVQLTLPFLSLSVLLLGTEASFLRFGASVVEEPEAPVEPSSSSNLAAAAESEEVRDLNNPSLQVLGNNGSPSWVFPLGLCAGDCDSDDDCEGHLVCYERSSSSDGSVPGCSGTDTKGLDYCIDPNALSNGGQDDYFDDGNNNDQNTGDQSTSFAETAGPSLYKMHWESWYFWQEEHVERRWCIQAYQNRPGSRARIYNCDSGEASMLVFERPSGGDAFQIRVAGENICLQRPDTLEDYCYFETCDGSEAQKWTGRNGNAFGSGTFEISPASLPGYCITITHQPRETEQLWVSTCQYTEENLTSLWAKYKIGS